MNISELLNRYFEGESSIEEERSLKAYFSGNDVADEHKVYQDLFDFYSVESEITFEQGDSIDLLLEKYFEGESSIEEEKALKNYYASGEVSEEHEAYADLFLFFSEEAAVSYEGEDSIDLLLEKYFAGETEIEEEQKLKTYYNSDNVAEEHMPYAELFGYFSEAQTEVLEKNIDLNKGRTLHLIRRTMMGIAAGLALVIGSVYVMNISQQNDTVAELTAIEEAEAEEALETTMEALAFLGVKFNKGKESLEQIKNLERTEIFKN